MEESYETFEEELEPQRANPTPQRPTRPIRRPEYATRKIKEDMASVPLQIKAEPKEPKLLPRDASFTKASPIPQVVSNQNVNQTEMPWESVTLNRCLFIAITILVLTSGFQRLGEALKGQGVADEEEEDEFGLTMRRSAAMRHRPESETTLLEVIFSWLPDLDEDEDEEEDVRVKKRRLKRQGAKTLSGLRNKPFPDIKLLKQRNGKIKGRQAKKSGEKCEDLEVPPDNKHGGNVEKVSKKSSEGKKQEKDSKGIIKHH